MLSLDFDWICVGAPRALRAAIASALAVFALAGNARADSSLPLATPEEVGMSSERLERLSHRMRSYVEAKKLAGIVTLVSRRGQVIHLEAFGSQSLETQAPMKSDSLFRIYSMTKPITSVATLMLYEEGKLRLADPVSKFAPELEGLRALKRPDGPLTQTEALKREPTIRDLLTHTAGFVYDFSATGPLAAAYRDNDILGSLATLAPQAWIARLAKLPLAYQPGTHWNYGVNTDVLGYVISAASGIPFDEFLRTRIFEPLRMRDTFFTVPTEKQSRFTGIYSPGPDGALVVSERGLGTRYVQPPAFPSGGGGLVSTAADYWRFDQMLLDGGATGPVRILSPKAVELMTTNALSPDERKGFAWVGMPGNGFGLGVSVVDDLGATSALGSAGAFGWGGAAGTIQWVDPQEELIAVLMIQISPPNSYPIQDEFRALVYQAIEE
jgi:CubicO group peptidase (beta-lactamase class C family)